ncbi:MAG: hypothetical protein HND53_08835 [Proteobacteria bacterium]|nr:hypothetical protein [Pseudomonadota bacterium]NOG60589.1 hypothetical protein [Pseudomonadota bacterium]
MSEEKDGKPVTEKIQQENIKKEIVADKKDDAANDKKSGSKSIIIFAIILIVIVAAISVFINNRLNRIESDIAENNTAAANINQKTKDRIEDVLSRFTSVQKKLDELESRQDVLSHSLSQQVEQQIHINEDYALAEIEHLLIIASYNLQLDHNVSTALSAMEAADARLNGLTDPAVIKVREQLIADMNELRSLNQADLSGMALFLSDLINRVDNLSLKENVVIEEQLVVEKKNEEQSEGIRHFFAMVFKELKSLIVITRDKDVGKARLLPDEVYFLKANLKLELANARFAVFNRDTENLRASINQLQSWLDNYFDLADADVRNIHDSLSSMKKIDLDFPELDISSSLESVRALSRIQDESNNENSEELILQQ